MSVERILPDTERTRRTAGLVILAVTVAGLVPLAWALTHQGTINVPTAILLAVVAGLAFLGFRLAFNRQLVLLVDTAARTYVVVRKGQAGEPQPLDELAPLLVTLRTRTVKTKNGTRTITEYAVHPGGERELDFHVVTTPGEARRRLEKLARAWHLSSRSYGGELRPPELLDRPLHERLRGDLGAECPPLPADSALAVQTLAPGYAITSRHRSWWPLGQAALVLLPATYIGYSLRQLGPREMVRSVAPFVTDTAYLGLVALVILALLVKLASGVRDTFFPGTVRITPDGVAYRFSRMPLDQIEEVIDHDGIELVGDRKTLRIPACFCAAGVRRALAREIQQRIVEMGPYAPMR